MASEIKKSNFIRVFFIVSMFGFLVQLIPGTSEFFDGFVYKYIDENLIEKRHISRLLYMSLYITICVILSVLFQIIMIIKRIKDHFYKDRTIVKIPIIFEILMCFVGFVFLYQSSNFIVVHGTNFFEKISSSTIDENFISSIIMATLGLGSFCTTIAFAYFYDDDIRERQLELFFARLGFYKKDK